MTPALTRCKNRSGTAAITLAMLLFALTCMPASVAGANRAALQPASAVAMEEVDTRGGGNDAEARNASPADPSPWHEEPVTVGAEGWALPGILTRPAAGPAKASVVFVHGSGPHDADQTIFGNKPFRDLAEGLARHGIASLRYVKRSREHATRLVAQADTLTVREEVVDDAVAAVAFLQSAKAVPGAPVFLLGHSLGGFLAPRIAHEAAGLSGVIVMAGNARPLEDLVLEQVRTLASAQGITEAQIAAMETQRENVKALARGDAVDGPLLLNLPASYWRDLSQYDPIASARQLDLPMLFVQGERDYQVTLADLAAWREGLAVRSGVQLRSYPALNHLFISGDGPSSPAEYLTPGRIDARVIDDIATWILDIDTQAQP